MVEEPKTPRRATPIPWLKLARALTLAFDARKLVLGCTAMLLIQAGFVVLNRFAPSESSAAPDVLNLEPIGPASLSGAALEPMFFHAMWEVAEPARLLIGPMIRLFAIDVGVLGAVLAALHLALAVVVLGILGGALARSAVCEVGQGRRPPIVECLRFAWRSARPLTAPALLPIVAAAACGLVCAILGILYRLPFLGAPLAGLTFFAPLALGILMALLLIHLAAAWPLIHVSVAVDAESMLDALGRAFGCVHRRPVQFASCAAIAWLAGGIGLLAFDALLRISVHLAAWGLNATTSSEIVAGLVRPDQGARSLQTLAGTVPFFWVRIVKAFSHAWVYAYFWSAATVIYLILREDVDGAPWTRIKDHDEAML